MYSQLLLPELQEMLQTQDTAGVREFCEALHPAVIAQVLESLDNDQICQVLDYCGLHRRVEIVEFLTPNRQLDLVRGMSREKVLATVTRLLETTLIRVGNDEYAQQNGSYGLTTLHNHHAQVRGEQITFQFKGKSGKRHSIDVRDPRLAKLDPGPPASIVECCTVALALRKLLAEHGLECFAKTSGSKGLQLFVPLNTPTTYGKTKPFAQRVAERIRESAPQMIVTQMRRALRPGKVFIDWSQNDPHKTTVGVYSLRARPTPTVSTPVTWAEVHKGARSRDPQTLVFDSAAVLQRVKRRGDLFAPLLTLRQRLPKEL